MPIGGGSSNNRTGVKTGTLVFVAHGNDPGDNAGDYLPCDGSNVSRSTYAMLFAKIGVVWGAGDGATTFTLPDSRRRKPVGSGGVGTAILGNAVGNTGGEETHAPTAAEMFAHTHSIPSLSVTATGSATGSIAGSTSFGDSAPPFTYPLLGSNSGDPAGSMVNCNRGGFNNGSVSVSGSTGTGTSGSNGSSTAFNVRDPSFITPIWIKT